LVTLYISVIRNVVRKVDHCSNPAFLLEGTCPHYSFWYILVIQSYFIWACVQTLSIKWKAKIYKSTRRVLKIIEKL